MIAAGYLVSFAAGSRSNGGLPIEAGESIARLAPVLRQVPEKRPNIPIAPDYAERMIL
jgi:hypothetical protein